MTGSVEGCYGTPRCLDAVVFVRFAALQHGMNYRQLTMERKPFLLHCSILDGGF
jgi:hypothetical protein